MRIFQYVADYFSHAFLRQKLKSSSTRAQFYRDIHAIEEDSAWQLHRLFTRLDDPRARAKVFLHILEEEGHAKIFKDGYQQETSTPFIPKQAPRREIEDASEPAWKFFAHLNAGERDAAKFFVRLDRAMDEKHLSAKIKKILQEEMKHVTQTISAPAYLDVSNDAYVDHVRKVDNARRFDGWLTALQTVISAVVNALLFGAYFLLAPVFFLFARKRLAARQHVYDNNQRKTF